MPSSAALPSAQKWTCDRCAVSVSRLDGGATVQPDCWTESEEGRFCLVCSRARAGEAALDDAPAETTPDERMRIRRTGLIEFEMLRSPELLDRRIATACHTSASAVATVRRDLAASDAAAAIAGRGD